MKFTEQEQQPCIEHIKMEPAPKINMFSSVDEIAKSLSSNPQIEYNYSKKKIHETAKEMQFTMFGAHIMNEKQISNKLTNEIVDEYLKLSVAKYPNNSQISRYYKQFFPEDMWSLIEYCISYKVYSNKQNRTRFEEGTLVCLIKSIKDLLKSLDKFDFIPRNEHLVEIAKDVLKDYNDNIKPKPGKRCRKQHIEMIDVENGSVVHTFVTRNEIVEMFNISKQRVGKILKSSKDNPNNKQLWEKVKCNGKRYWLSEHTIEKGLN